MNIKTDNFLQITNPNIKTNISNPEFVGIFSKNKDVKKDEFVKEDEPKKPTKIQKIVAAIGAGVTVVGSIFGIKKLKTSKNIDTNTVKNTAQKAKTVVEGVLTQKPKKADVEPPKTVVPEQKNNITENIKPESPSKLKVEPQKPEVEPVKVNAEPVPQKTKIVTMPLEEVFEKYPPRNYDLAQEIYPTLHKNAEVLGLKPEHYEDILSNINKRNKEFMKTEGFDLIAKNIDKLKDLSIEKPENELGLIVANLNHSNKNIFSKVLESPETFKIDYIEDVATYLSNLKPKNEEYTFGKGLSLLEKHEKDLRLVDAERFSLALNSMSEDIEDVVPLLAKENSFQNLKKYRMLMNTTKDNKECLIPLIQNMEKLGLDSENAAITLKELNNVHKNSIVAVANKVEKINELKFDKLDVLKRLNKEHSAEIFERVINNPEMYKIKEVSDISYYVRLFEGKDLDFIEKTAIPRLMENAKPLRIYYAEDIAEITGNLTPKTLEHIETVAQYAQKYGNNVNYTALLAGLTEDNAKNLRKVLDNIENTGLWDDNMVCGEDFKHLLDRGV